ncbi:MAG: hypothetical protein JW809_19665 [Pirellulales bacterium]|nr:hypothetical protein [Pirellulales bacterium]
MSQTAAAPLPPPSQPTARPLVDAGPPWGPLPLVVEVNCAEQTPDREDPPDASRVESILGRPCRVLAPAQGEASYFSYRIGRGAGLAPGAAYVLAVEYPEDAPRAILVRNGGNECSRGFHTGATFGDAFHPKYVNNNNESLRVPLSNRYETWATLFRLHDRFPDLAFPRGEGPRPLVPADGFDVTIAQFSAADAPASQGAAVARIRLFEVPDVARLKLPVAWPPAGLPRRHVFWREEMADGVIAGNKEEERGLREPLDWYRHKADLMDALGIDTFGKDLLEFGACQHWDSTDGGGNKWVHFDWNKKGLWVRIVELMGNRGFSILPYYEYAGSKGDAGLGYQRRAKPLSRDDAFTHIEWIESANADVTDPEAIADLQKILDLTIIRFKDKAHFLGAWIRPRSQLPIGFGEPTLARFAQEANQGRPVTRAMLRGDKALLGRYHDWWYGKRRDFLVAMRDHLRRAGVNPRAVVLFTASAAEPGVSFPTWEKQFVTDDVPGWTERLRQPDVSQGKTIVPQDIQTIVAEGRYLDALLSAPLNWGGWEVDHANPPADPDRYRDVDGVLLTYCFNRAYTVGSPAVLDRFRGPSGLALVRHYTLNENMLFDKQDQPKLGYFVADVERAGPCCMLAEARAVAHGDPNYLGYLVGSSFNRGFARHVRDFHAAYLSLPALPSRVLPGAASDAEVVVRAIGTPSAGTFFAVVNTGLDAKRDVAIRLGATGQVTDAATGEPLPAEGGRVTLSFHPCQLRALRAAPAK